VVVVTRTERAPAVETLVRRFTVAPIFYAWTELQTVLRAPALAVEMPSDCRDAKFFAFCGIGNHPAFFADLRRWGFSLAGEKSLPDHHRYSAADGAQLERAAALAGADALICTEKDVFNLRGAIPASLPVYACRIRLAFSDAEGFWSAVKAAAARSASMRQTVSAS
jgi:tetraacyldisaccharide-1-P 4'-kinase